jgi:hypothetical protein
MASLAEGPPAAAAAGAERMAWPAAYAAPPATPAWAGTMYALPAGTIIIAGAATACAPASPLALLRPPAACWCWCPMPGAGPPYWPPPKAGMAYTLLLP